MPTSADKTINNFLQNLVNQGKSKVSIKNYKSDIGHFLSWITLKLKTLGTYIQNASEITPFVSESIFDEYKSYMVENKVKTKTTNRRLSTLRNFSKFLYSEGLVDTDFMQGIQNVGIGSTKPQPKNSADIVNNFRDSLILQKVAPNTIKNYAADVKSFVDWAGTKSVNNIASNHIKSYRDEVLKTSSASTFDRKVSSLKKFFDWALHEGHVDENPIELFLKDEEKIISTKLGKIEKENKAKSISYNSFQARIVAKLAVKPKLQKLVYNLFYTRPKWYQTYHTLPIATYFNYAILILLMSAVGFGVYNQFFKTTSNPLAYPTSLTRPGRYLSFQGRLTNILGNPITSATNVDFKLYNASQSGTLLWDSAVCSITPDTDGIFATLLGNNCGSEIPASVFSENASVWLGVTVGSDAEATPRVQIATVAYALNSETLQGYPASSSATANTVPVMNNLGQIVLAAASPKIQSTSGNFGIEGQSVTIATPTSSNGNITLAPDGTGVVNLTFAGAAPGGSAEGFINATNANITSGALYYGGVASNASGYNLIQLASGSTPTDKFTVDSAGNTMIAGNITSATWTGNMITSLYGGTGANNSTAAQYSIPYYSTTGVLGGVLAPSTSGYVLSTNNTGGAPSWIPMSAAGNWSLGAGVLYPGNTTLDVLIGSSATTSAKFAFKNVLTGTPTASISGSTASVATYLDGNGNLSLTNMANLTLGSSTTGNVIINSRGSAALTANGANLTAGGILYLANGTTYYVDASGNANLNAGTFAGTLTANGNTQIGNATSDTLTIWPNTWTLSNSTPNLDLKDATVNALAFETSLMSFDTSNSRVGVGTTAPTATLDVAGAASVSGSLTFRTGASSIQTTAFNPLTIGGATTGNITLNPSNAIAGGYVAPNTTNVSDLGTASLLWRNIRGTTIYQGANQVCDTSGNCSSGGFWDQALGALYPVNNTVDLLLGSTATTSAKFAFTGVNSGTPTASISGSVAGTATSIDGNGNIITQKAQTLTLGGTTTGNVVINSRGSAALTANGANLTAGGILYLANGTTYYVDASGNANLNNGTLVGNTQIGDATSDTLTIWPNTWTLSNSTPNLDLKNSTVNALSFETSLMSFDTSNTRVGVGTIAPTSLLDVAGSASVSGSLSFRTGAGSIQTTAFNPFTLGGATTGNITLNPSNAVAGGYVAPNTTNVTDLGTSSLLWRNLYATTLYQGVNQVCDLSGNCTAATDYWSVGNGTIYPKNNSVDMLLGSNATTSAKFAFKNVLTGTPTASISGSTANVSLFMDGNGNLSSTNRNNLTLGNSATYNTTGNILLNPNGTGYVGIGTTSPQGMLQLGSGQLLLPDGYAGGPSLSFTNNTNMGFYRKQNNVMAAVANGQEALMFSGDTGIGTMTIGNVVPVNEKLLIDGSGSMDFMRVSSGSNENGDIFTIKRTGNIGVGTVTPNALLDVAGTASISGILTLGNGTTNAIQSAYGPLTLNYKSGADAWSAGLTLTNSGLVGIGTTTPGGKLHVYSNSGQRGIQSWLTSSDITLGSVYGTTSDLYVTPTDQSATNYYGNISASTLGNDMWVNGALVGNSSTAYISSNGTANSIYGQTIKSYISNGYTGNATTSAGLVVWETDIEDGTALNASGARIYTPTVDTGSITGSAFGINIQAGAALGSGSIANLYPLYIEPDSRTVTTNKYGMYMGTMSGATNNYQLYIAGTANNYFAGKVGIGNTTPNAVLDVTGTASISGVLTLGNGTTNAIQSAYGPLTLNYKSGADAWSAGLTLTNTGYVGIGTTTPAVAMDVNGYVRAQRFEDQTTPASFYIDPAAATTSVSIEGNIVSNGAFSISSGGGNITIDAGGNDVIIGDGSTSKLNAGTIDPPYTINGNKYATYVSSMTGVKEETTGTVATTEVVPGQGYRAALDFEGAADGSDLWIFSNVTELSTNLDKLVVLLSPASNTKAWYTFDASGKIYIYTSRPTTVSYRLTAPRFDAEKWSNERRADEIAGFIIPDTNIWPGTGTSTDENQISFNNLTVNISTDSGEKKYTLIDSLTNTVVDEVLGLSKAIIANVKAGIVVTEDLATTSFTAFQGTVDNMLIKSGLVAGRINTKLISPLADETDITIKLGNATESGKLAIQNGQGQEVASINSSGDATFSGTLYADKIDSKSLDDIKSLLTQVQVDQSLLAEASTWGINSTNSANLDQIATADLYVTNQAAINTLSVTNTLAIGSDMAITDNSIDTLSSPLKIQSLAIAPIEMMAGLIKIDTKGNVQITGDLAVGGKVESSSLNIIARESTQSGQLLTLHNQNGNVVSSVDSSGSAEFTSVSTQGLTIAGATGATSSAIVDGVITTNSTVGSGIIKAGTSEIRIKNPNVSDYSLVYVTPTSSTNNYVLYVKSKAPGEFVVGFTNPIDVDVNFNWWIVKVSQ